MSPFHIGIFVTFFVTVISVLNCVPALAVYFVDEYGHGVVGVNEKLEDAGGEGGRRGGGSETHAKESKGTKALMSCCSCRNLGHWSLKSKQPVSKPQDSTNH